MNESEPIPESPSSEDDGHRPPAKAVREMTEEEEQLEEYFKWMGVTLDEDRHYQPLFVRWIEGDIMRGDASFKISWQALRETMEKRGFFERRTEGEK